MIRTVRMRRKSLLVTFAVLSAVTRMSAQVPAWQPSPGHTQLPIWPTTIAAGRPGVIAETLGQGTKPVAGRPWLYIGHVTVPTLTVYSPEGNNTGAAVVVFPGGGYEILAIDLEGTEVCDWLVSRGITCVLLKYRVPNQGGSWDQGCGCDRRTGSSRPLEDAQRAIALVRFHAADWHIDPHKIGVLGFSAGGHLVAAVSTHFDRPVYRAVDSADQESTRPDFAVAVYPGHLFDRRTGSLYHDLPVTARTPPTLLVQAENDEVDPPNHSIFYFMALKKAGVPAELHLYAEGGHAFGLRPTNFPITAWPRLVETWLKTIGMTSP